MDEKLMNYIKSNFNQLANAANPYQSEATKALTVCSAGLLRSPTMAKFLTNLGYNTRACGTSMDYALVPISHALAVWADEFHVVAEQYPTLLGILAELSIDKPIYTYNIPDNYETFSPDLLQLIEDEYANTLQD